MRRRFEMEFRPSHPEFRTRVCRHWLMGTCDRGASLCNFLHSAPNTTYCPGVDRVVWAGGRSRGVCEKKQGFKRVSR